MQPDDQRASVVRDCDVAVAAGFDGYGDGPPFSPDEAYAEYPFSRSTLAAGPNPAYAAVRESLRLLGLDAARFGSAEWNPLGGLIAPGQTVLLKPNFVRDYRETIPGHDDCLITHGAVLRAVADYAYKALRGEGRLIIADAPQNDADFAGITAITRFDAIQAFYASHAKLPLEVYDMRPERAVKHNGVIVGHEKLPGDPLGFTKVNLGRHSLFAEIEELCHLLYGSEYDREELHAHQRGGVHEYLICKSVLSADCVISVPKLKTHKKTGLTVNLKNLVGINGNKNWLPHHREGTPSQGGDQFKDDSVKRRVERRVVEQFKRVFPLLGPARRLLGHPAAWLGKRVFGDTNRGTIRSGNWYGNDTTWRMVIDLNRILYYARPDGTLAERPPRTLFSVVDGIVGGEGNGPMDADARPTGVVLAGRNAVAVDLVCARLMDFDYRKTPVLRRCLEPHGLPLTDFTQADVRVHSNREDCDGPLGAWRGKRFAYRAHFGWTGHIELDEDDDEAGAVAQEPVGQAS